MIRLTDTRVRLTESGSFVPASQQEWAFGRKKTMAWKILQAHSQSGDEDRLQLKFDALVSPDNNYVSILQTARAGGLTEFPVPYVLSNCHHTLCAVGGTVNEDDHVFGLGSAKKYGGIFVPPYRAVLHQYMREMMAGCGSMILGSDSHSRYGALGAMGVGEGGGEIVKQLLGRTWDSTVPQVLAVRLTGSPRPGVGPQDVALALVGATFKNGFARNRVLEFIGSGIDGLSMEYRIGIDVMTTESAALSSIWCTDEKTREYLSEHGREEAYRPLSPQAGACYDGLLEIELDRVPCMIALPFHPGNAMPIREFQENLRDVLAGVEAEGRRIKGKTGKPFSIMSHIRDGGFYPDQALVGGCCGGLFENMAAIADILRGTGIRADGLNLGVNPASMPIMADLMAQGIAGELAVCGVTIRPCICGACFGVTDVPADNALSIRHMTRNYPNREGSKPGQGQMAASFLMDARSIAATVRNGGRLTAADGLDVTYRNPRHHFDPEIYENQVYFGYGKKDEKEELVMGPNIADWPAMPVLPRHLLLITAGSYAGSVTTDELIPSGEVSSFRSNPEKISDYMMISRDPDYVGRAKAVRSLSRSWDADGKTGDPDLDGLLAALAGRLRCEPGEIGIGSLMVSDVVGDGSSREQAASSQKVLGGFADLANEYSTKRYRSNLINWGLLPLRTQEKLSVPVGTRLLIPDVRALVKRNPDGFAVEVLGGAAGEKTGEIICTLDSLTGEERQILLAGCLINHYKK